MWPGPTKPALLPMSVEGICFTASNWQGDGEKGNDNNPSLTTLLTQEKTRIIDAEVISCLPAKKRVKVIDTERIIMGEELK